MDVSHENESFSVVFGIVKNGILYPKTAPSIELFDGFQICGEWSPLQAPSRAMEIQKTFRGDSSSLEGPFERHQFPQFRMSSKTVCSHEKFSYPLCTIPCWGMRVTCTGSISPDFEMCCSTRGNYKYEPDSFQTCDTWSKRRWSLLQFSWCFLLLTS